MSRRGIEMSRADVEAHQRKHGFLKGDDITWMEQSQTQLTVPSNAAPTFKPKRAAKQPNKTERDFGLILEARKRNGEISDYFYEGITLHWGDGMRYTPDWVVYAGNYNGFWRPLLIEIKGGWIWSRDSVRFKGCRAEWSRFYDFELHQKKAGSWTRLL